MPKCARLLCSVISFAAVSFAASEVISQQISPLAGASAESVGRILSGISSSGELSRLPKDARSAFLDRFNKFLTVRCEGTADDYIALMKSWGCTLRVVKDSPEYRQMIEGWHPIGTRSGIASIEKGSVRVRVLLGDEAADATTARWEQVQDPVGMRTLMFSAFSPNPPQTEMLRINRTAIEVVYVATMTDGARLTTGYRFAWDRDSNAWYPLSGYEEVPPGRPLPRQFY